MNKVWIVLLVCVVAVAAFLLGQRARDPEPASGAIRADAVNVASAPEPAHDKEAVSPEPPQTFRGPDGLPHLINYSTGVGPDSKDPVQVRAGVLADMKNHPKNIARAYDLSLAEIEAIVAGKRPIPAAMLPAAANSPSQK